MNAESRIRRLEALVAELARRVEEAEDAEDIEFGGGERNVERRGVPPGPMSASAAPPAVGVGAVGTELGTFALEDHTHDVAAPVGEEGGGLPAPCTDYGGILRSHVTGGVAAWERRCLADGTTLSLAFGNGVAAGVDWEEVEKLEVGFIDEGASPSPAWAVRDFVVMPEPTP